MEDLKLIVAANISRLRKDAGLTQSELAERINYSDKSVSKWERAEALPDLSVSKQISELFGVSVDFLLSSHDEWNVTPPNPPRSYNSGIITSIAITGIMAIALLLFLIFYFTGVYVWEIFAYGVGVSLITLLVLNNVWQKPQYNLAIVSLIVLWVFAMVYLHLLPLNLWPLVFLLFLAEVIVFLSFHIKRRRKNK